MSSSEEKKSGERTAVIFSTQESNLTIALMDILHKRNYKVHGSYSSEQKVFNILNSGEASLLIIDDQKDMPASMVLRQQIFNLIPALTPTIALCSQRNELDVKCMAAMGEPAIVPKPVTPNELLAGFDELDEKWSTYPFSDLLKARSHFIEGQRKSGYQILIKMVRDHPVPYLASSVLSLFYRSQNDFLMTEKLLYSAYKESAFKMSIVLPLIDLYLYNACPGSALDLIDEANEEFGNPNFLCVDAIQANLMLNRVRECEPFFTQMIENDYSADLAKFFLPRIAYSSGLLDLFDQSIRYKPDLFDQYQRAWHVLKDKDAKRRLGQYENVAASKKYQDKLNRERQKAGLEQKEVEVNKTIIDGDKPLFDSEDF